MTTFYEIPFLWRSMMGLWALLICCLCITSVVIAIYVKRYRNIFLSVLAFAPAFFFWQVYFDLYLLYFYGPESDPAASICLAMGDLYWPVWMFSLLILTVAALLPLYLNIRYILTSVTPLSIKICADKVNCGICYWRDNGHVIFSNDCMNHLCSALTNETLMNGNRFNEALKEEILFVDQKVWRFYRRDLEFEGAPLHELMAVHITELYDKTQLLRKDVDELARMNEELKEYSLKIDETVRKQEILQAKVNIHDEMNRLMLSTVSADCRNEEEITRIFSLWQKNALLLCMEADRKTDKDAVDRLERMAKTLGVELIWRNILPESLTNKQRELFFAAAQEAITNAVKHAKASKMEVSFVEAEQYISCHFENDGEIPSGEIKFSGGLANLAILASEQHVSVAAEAGQTYDLSLRFPREN